MRRFREIWDDKKATEKARVQAHRDGDLEKATALEAVIRGLEKEQAQAMKAEGMTWTAI
jgi:hypothetical protein